MRRVCVLLLLAALLVSALSGCGLQVPRPEIKVGEFAFSVTYELNGKTKTVSGVYVCEFAGTDWALDGGYSRAWDSYIEYGYKAQLSYSEDDSVVIGLTENDDTMWLDFGFDPEYFMGDPGWASWEGVPEPALSIGITTEEGFYFETDAAVIEETYGAKLISYEYAEPIENTFGLFK